VIRIGNLLHIPDEAKYPQCTQICGYCSGWLALLDIGQNISRKANAFGELFPGKLAPQAVQPNRLRTYSTAAGGDFEILLTCGMSIKNLDNLLFFYQHITKLWAGQK